MKVSDAIQSRRSVKHYDPAHVMSPDETTRLLSHAMLAPTAFNIQHWRFVHVQDMALRQEIRKVAWDQSQVTDASMLLVLCADTKAWEKAPPALLAHCATASAGFHDSGNRPVLFGSGSGSA